MHPSFLHISFLSSSFTPPSSFLAWLLSSFLFLLGMLASHRRSLLQVHFPHFEGRKEGRKDGREEGRKEGRHAVKVTTVRLTSIACLLGRMDYRPDFAADSTQPRYWRGRQHLLLTERLHAGGRPRGTPHCERFQCPRLGSASALSQRLCGCLPGPVHVSGKLQPLHPKLRRGVWF